MKIITEHPIEVFMINGKKAKGQIGSMGKFQNWINNKHPEVVSNIDGTNPTQVREFQVWASMYHSAQLAADGIMGPLTTVAYDKWGAEWEITQPKIAPKPKETTKPVKKDEPTLPVKKDEVVVPVKKDEPLQAKGWKALPMPAKVGIITGGSILVIGLIWILIPKKK